jgi:hypothetical protein
LSLLIFFCQQEANWIYNYVPKSFLAIVLSVLWFTACPFGIFKLSWLPLTWYIDWLSVVFYTFFITVHRKLCYSDTTLFRNPNVPNIGPTSNRSDIPMFRNCIVPTNDIWNNCKVSEIHKECLKFDRKSINISCQW